MHNFRTCVLPLVLALLLLTFLPTINHAQNKSDNITSEVLILLNKGYVALNKKEISNAEHLYIQARDKARLSNDKRGEATALGRLGNLYYSINRVADALEAYKAELPIEQTLKDNKSVAAVYSNMGNCYAQLNQSSEAIAAYQKSSEMSRLVGDKNTEANTLVGMATLYFDMQMPEKSLETAQQALRLAKIAKDKIQQVAALAHIGVVNYTLGLPKVALKALTQARDIAKEVKDWRGELYILNTMGVVCGDIGLPQSALEYLHLSRVPRQKIGDNKGEAQTCNNIGNVYLHLGKPTRARDYFRTALLLLRKETNPAEKTSNSRACALYLSNLGTAYLEMGNPQQAKWYYRQALRLSRAVKAQDTEATILQRTGDLYLYSSYPLKSLEWYHQSLKIAEAHQDLSHKAVILNNIGYAYANTGQQERALSFFHQALSIATQIEARNTEIAIWNNIGMAQKFLKHPGEASIAYEAAVEKIEIMREHIGGSPQERPHFISQFLHSYHSYIDLLLLQSDSDRAFAITQKTKARVLLALMSQGKIELNTFLTPLERKKEKELRQTVNTLNAKLLEANGNPQTHEELRQQFKAKEYELRAYTDELYAKHPEAAQQRAAKTVTRAEIAKFLPEDTAILEYVVLRSGKGKETLDKTALFVVTNESGRAKLQVYPIVKTENELEQKVISLNKSCADKKATALYRPMARELFRILIAPAWKQLKGKKRIIVCPDGPLWNAPFAVFMNGNKHIIESHELDYAYSATGIKAVLDLKSRKNRRMPTRTLLAMANPDFGSKIRQAGKQMSTKRQTRATSHAPIVDLDTAEEPAHKIDFGRNSRLNPLPATQKEVDAIRQIFALPPAQMMIKTGKQAQETLFLQVCQQFRYIHLATHGSFNKFAPLESYIAFAQPPKGNSENGLLTVREIFELNLSADMVTLSACESGVGEKRRGEGMMGLTWALFAAGVPTQIVSQWQVNDMSTAQIMQRFYNNMLQHRMPKGQALRQAALTLLHSEHYQHPHHWAPFVLFGAWR